MKTIEEAARESAKSKLNKLYDGNSLRTFEHIRGFKACAKFMEQMIPVSEELPTKENGYYCQDVIIQDKYNGMGIGTYGALGWMSHDVGVDIKAIVSWRPLKRR